MFGRNLELVGTAEAASEGSVGGADLLVRPMLRVAELLEAVPGMVAVQHSGSGKANQYFLRGFNLDHGTDFTTYVDGVPLNLRSHGHGQGYLDVNGLDARDRRAHRLPQGPVSRRRRRLRDGGCVVHHDDRPVRRAVRRARRRRGRLGSGSRAAARWSFDDGATLTGMIEHKTLRRSVGAPRRSRAHRALGQVPAPDGLRHAGRHRVGLRRQLASRRSRFPERAIGTSVCEDAFCVLDPTADGRHVALDRRRAARRRRVERVGLRAVLRLVHVVEPDLRLPDQSVRQALDDGRPLRAHAAREPTTSTVNVGGEFRYDDIGNVGARRVRCRRSSSRTSARTASRRPRSARSSR